MSGQNERRIERLGELIGGMVAWRLHGDEGWAFTLPPGVVPQLADAKPPTRKVVQRHCGHDSDVVLATASENQGQPVEWELSGDKIIGVRLVEDDE